MNRIDLPEPIRTEQLERVREEFRRANSVPGREIPPFECFELPWPASWTLWIVLFIGFAIGICVGVVLA